MRKKKKEEERKEDDKTTKQTWEEWFRKHLVLILKKY